MAEEPMRDDTYESQETRPARTCDVQGVLSSGGTVSSDMDGWLFQNPKDAAETEKLKEAVSRVSRDDEHYDMNHKRRGVALLFNHINFDGMTQRRGTIKDGADLESVLNDLDFEVRVFQDPSVTTIARVVKATAAEDHTDADCLVVVAMSHGESGLLHAYDREYSVDLLWTSFIGDRCPTLLGKPKLFFIQACRGKQLDKGAKIIHETDSASGYTIPAFADIMVAYSTYDGFYSWRSPDCGSWFIQALCEELKLNGRSRDLLTMMTFVNRRVAVEYQSYVPYDSSFNAKKQIPSLVSMLTRLVTFPAKATTVDKLPPFENLKT